LLNSELSTDSDRGTIGVHGTYKQHDALGEWSKIPFEKLIVTLLLKYFGTFDDTQPSIPDSSAA
jgi:hypothetical protein